jgi:thiamine-phosphate pyrophosphorylase
VTTRRLLCLVTDRRRLAASVGRAAGDASSLLIAQLEGAVRGGVDLVQIRERDLEAGALAAMVRDALRIAAGTATRVIVNDRIDVALAAGADGVHLREASVDAAAVRRVWPSLTIGRSVHSRASVIGATAVDYWIAGTIFPTDSKAAAATLGCAGLAEVVRAAAGTPVLAIGGVTAGRLPELVRAGATGLAAIGAFLPDRGEHDVAAAVEKRVATLRFAFDTASTVS